MKIKKALYLATVLSGLIASAPAHADHIGISIGIAPPALREEEIPPAPGPEDHWAWHHGHWRWIDGSYVWVHGHWVERPRAGAVWVEPRWERHEDNWVFVEGRWK